MSELPVAPELLFPAVGLLLFALGWPLATRRVRPNRWYGLRVPATFADERVWYEANAMTGRDLMALGLVLAIAALALPSVIGLHRATYIVVCAGILVIGSVALTVRGLRGANRLLRDRRPSARSP